MAIYREEWEGEVFENLEVMCREHPRAAEQAVNPPDEHPPKASESELARGLPSMPSFSEDDDAWCPRLA